jgi:hypothetical protein
MYVSARGFWDVINSTFIDPAIYPWFEIYPGHVSAGENGAAASRVTFSLQSAYPQFDICGPTIFPCSSFISYISYLKDPAVYPHFDIYRAGSPRKEGEQVPLLTMLPAQYPALSLCEFRHHIM